ncbi:ParA family protein [Rhodocyclus gracilis]|uniref:AAA family ATPase n=1 Tax=Rhodocyclus tenuis TaxID=1066 RepID=A0A6L5JUF8_RHOTE|nr:ParA family protein [Rhodocyclus gracilis]MQY50736.1 AAA family ATPase [Rhodocyclus gracilis]
MKSFLVANPKGGSGKSTLATNLAGYFARAGEQVMLGDTDVQQSSREWLRLRSPQLPRIGTWELGERGKAGEAGKAGAAGKSATGKAVSLTARPPAGTTRVVLDTPAGLHGKALERCVKRVNRVIVPVQPSLFDMLATRHFLETLLAEKAVRKERTFVAVVGMRVDARTRAASELESFLASYELPVLAYLRDTQLYPQTVANGMTLFDLPPSRAARDLTAWQPILEWLDAA